MIINEDTLKAWAREVGFCECALCDTEPFEQERLMTESQPLIKERRHLRFDPAEEESRVRSIAVLLWAYQPCSHPDAGDVFVDSYYDASNEAYHAARQLEARLNATGCYARANVAYPAKRAALRAGLGVVGKNSLLITHKHGTRVVIILMSVGIDPSIHHEVSCQSMNCLGCGRCIIACPVGALGEGGMLHPERCLRNFMMEGVVVPEEIRQKMGMNLIGCSICQQVCPMQPDHGSKHGESLPLSDLVTEDSAVFSSAVSKLAHRIGKNAARPQRIRAQAAILAGNSENPTFLPVLNKWAQSEHDVVREHALWAIRQICSE